MNISDLKTYQLVLPNQLSREQEKWFWDQNVDMDDWDLMVIVDTDEVEENEKDYVSENEHYQPIKTTIKYFTPKNYELESILYGSHYQKWYIVNFDEGLKAVGIKYH